ncbi:hypothetical protein GALMADRAFT_1352619 [Galerina marginata CBS 339.88]|uniref:Uncharacterized protein n=1 Tax=Galerina marginata (strain CBS 339.88) TaxID=685588 RepID=A0A067SNA6_GALM3|nr:hypothetical protein GALMADRAFT_1352619 [Galerina marginata CBS 339.88]
MSFFRERSFVGVYSLSRFIAVSGAGTAPPPLSAVVGCVQKNFDVQNANLSPLIAMVVNLIFLGLTLNKFREHRMFLQRSQIRIGTVLKALAMEGVIYFIGFVLVATLDFVICFRALSSLSALASIWVGAFYSYAGSHLILHLRSVGGKSDYQTATLIYMLRERSLRFQPDPSSKSWIGDPNNGGL